MSHIKRGVAAGCSLGVDREKERGGHGSAPQSSPAPVMLKHRKRPGLLLPKHLPRFPLGPFSTFNRIFPYSAQRDFDEIKSTQLKPGVSTEVLFIYLFFKVSSESNRLHVPSTGQAGEMRYQDSGNHFFSSLIWLHTLCPYSSLLLISLKTIDDLYFRACLGLSLKAILLPQGINLFCEVFTLELMGNI